VATPLGQFRVIRGFGLPPTSKRPVTGVSGGISTAWPASANFSVQHTSQLSVSAPPPPDVKINVGCQGQAGTDGKVACRHQDARISIECLQTFRYGFHRAEMREVALQPGGERLKV